MTREESIEILNQMYCEWRTDEEREAIELAIIALEQEPCEYYDTYNKTCRRSEVPKGGVNK